MANPDPEISPPEARAARPDAIIATGRSDYPNQVNNVLGFPFIFRGALDVRATAINDEMKIAAANALAELALEAVHDWVRVVDRDWVAHDRVLDVLAGIADRSRRSADRIEYHLDRWAQDAEEPSTAAAHLYDALVEADTNEWEAGR